MDALIDHSEVTAIVVTRGDVDLQPILAQMPFDDLVVWDNSVRDDDAKVFGRYLAMAEAANDVVFMQDDDIIFTAFDELLAAYEPGRITCNMPSPWWERTGYEQMQCGMVGAGSLVPLGISQQAFDRYLERWPKDDMFLLGCDWVHGILTPFERFDFGYEILDYASAPGRIWTSSEGPGLRDEMCRRALELR